MNEVKLACPRLMAYFPSDIISDQTCCVEREVKKYQGTDLYNHDKIVYLFLISRSADDIIEQILLSKTNYVFK